MSNIIDELSSISSINSQIIALQTQKAAGSSSSTLDSNDPRLAIYNLQQNFDKILTSFLSVSGQSENDNSKNLFGDISSIEDQLATARKTKESGQTVTPDPQKALLALTQNINNTTGNFFFLPDSSNSSGDNEEPDPFSTWPSYQTALNKLNLQISQNNGSSNVSTSLNAAQSNLLSLQFQADLNNITIF